MKDDNKIIDGEQVAPSSGSTSSSLLEGVKARDPEAWKRLAQLYGPLVYGWCRRQGLQARDCEDVLQEVFLTVSLHIGGFQCGREHGSFRAWLWTITRNKLGDWIRQQRTREQAAGGSAAQQLLLQVPAEDLSSSEEAENAGNLYHRARDLIRAEFEERSWQAFWRVTVEGQRAADVAVDLGMTRNAVYIATCRILRRIRDVLGDE